ncbi:MAG TPA: epoxyalkane--coenzyme M transferase [Gammaproteobacteria bacterium]|nr:epoxyalkane--coenzyme M transferase [Gammaproteobacteria bacterium]
MLRSTERILTSHVGSLIRPADVMRLMIARDKGAAHDEAAAAALLDRAVAGVVREQAAAGIDIVNDGEFGKSSFLGYVRTRLGGLEMRKTGTFFGLNTRLKGYKMYAAVAREREEFADFYKAWGAVETTVWLPPEIRPEAPVGPPTELPVCTGPITYIGMDELSAELARLKAALGRVSVAGAFVPVASAPLCAFGARVNEHYERDEDYLFALADAMNQEYKAIVAAGFDIQIDSPELTHLYDPDNVDDYLRWLALQVEAINHSLRGIPEERARLHVCWGSWNAPHTTDVPLKTILDTILKVRTQGYSLEGANDRHMHEVLLWDDVKLPEGKVLLPGVVGHVSNVIEHPELVAWRIGLYAERVGRENVIACTDCGYSQGWNIPRVHPQVQWAKLKALGEGARLASAQLWRKGQGTRK